MRKYQKQRKESDEFSSEDETVKARIQQKKDWFLNEAKMTDLYDMTNKIVNFFI